MRWGLWAKQQGGEVVPDFNGGLRRILGELVNMADSRDPPRPEESECLVCSAQESASSDAPSSDFDAQ